MIALLSSALTVDGGDLDGLNKAVAACDRGVVSRAAADEAARHGAFLVSSFAEQQAIAAARADLAERRRRMRGVVQTAVNGKPTDTDAALVAAEKDVEDRQQALDDARGLDRAKSDAVGWFRQLYISRCPGKGA